MALYCTEDYFAGLSAQRGRTINGLAEEFFPDPEDGDGTQDAEDEVSEIIFACELDVEDVADKGAGITANDAHDEVHATAFALTTHDAVGYISNKDTCENGPGREICYVVEHDDNYFLEDEKIRKMRRLITGRLDNGLKN